MMNENLANGNEIPQILVEIAEPFQTPSKSNIEMVNTSNVAMAFKFKIDFWKYVTIEPCHVGLIQPRDRKSFVLTLHPGYDIRQRYHVFLATAVCPNAADSTSQSNPALIWQEVVESDITVARIQLSIVHGINIINPNTVHLIYGGYNPQLSIVDRVKSVIERIRREGLTTDAVLGLSLLFSTGYVVGCMLNRIRTSVN